MGIVRRTASALLTRLKSFSSPPPFFSCLSIGQYDTYFFGVRCVGRRFGKPRAYMQGWIGALPDGISVWSWSGGRDIGMFFFFFVLLILILPFFFAG